MSYSVGKGIEVLTVAAEVGWVTARNSFLEVVHDGCLRAWRKLAVSCLLDDCVGGIGFTGYGGGGCWESGNGGDCDNEVKEQVKRKHFEF